jgi:hypothetical protein
MQTVLANLLKSHAPLEALVGSTIDWDETPQGVALPSIVMFVVSGIIDYAYSGATGYVVTRVQFDCRGSTAAAARAVAVALDGKLSGFSGEFEGIEFQGCFARGQRTRHDKIDAKTWFTDGRDFEIHWAPA